MKQVYIKTFGCQMNDQDSERMMQLLADSGYTPTAHPIDADLIIVNTCSVRDKAEQKVYSELGAYRAMARDNGRQIMLAVGGCVGQQEGKKLLKRAPYLSFVFGTHHLAELPKMVAEAELGRKGFAAKAFSETGQFVFPEDRLTYKRSTTTSALTVAHGCSKFCTFCVVPFTRGREISRSAAEVVREAERLADIGIVELLLLGQTVNGYRGSAEAPTTFAGLIRSLAAIPGIKRIRYTSPHPAEFTPELVALHGELDKLCPHIHLPLQSASDEILLRMARGYTLAEYRSLLAALRSARSDLAITTDFIVGFPGEQESDFKMTMDFLQEAGFDQSYSFKYSPRPFTKAAKYEGHVSEEVKGDRLARLQALQDLQTKAIYHSLVGKTELVLIDGKSKDGERLAGRTPHNRIVNVSLQGTLHSPFLRVTLEAACNHSFVGVVAP